MVLTKTREAEVRAMSRQEMTEARQALIESLSITEAELRARADQWDLSAAERGVLDEVDGLDFLLEHTPE